MKCRLKLIRDNGIVQIGCQKIISEHLPAGGGEDGAFGKSCEDRERTLFRQKGKELYPVFSETEEPGIEMPASVDIFLYIFVLIPSII